MTGDGRAAAPPLGAHPEAELLAAYAEGAVTPVERADVERHLVVCGECRDVLADTLAIVEELRASRPQPHPKTIPFTRRRLLKNVLFGLPAAAAVVLVVRTYPSWFGRAANQSQVELDGLMAALAEQPTRLTEGRLSSETAYRPAPAATRGSTRAELPTDLALAIAQLESAIGEDRSPASQYALGLAHLAAGEFDAAVTALESAAQDRRSDARLHNDLAAAYLARSSGRPNQADFERALEAANRALSLDPALPGTRFNRALALDALGRHDPASWQTAADREPGAEWQREAARRMSRP
jgi:hypothetical protein